MCPDSMDDVEELIMENGEVKIDSVKNPGEKAEVSGKLEFRILYRRPGRGTHGARGQHSVYGDGTYAGTFGK